MQKFLLAAALATLATPAFADAQWTAVPAAPAKATELVGGTIAWRCNASGCVSESDTSETDSRSECFALVRQLGPLSAYSDSKGPYTEVQLNKCNNVSNKSQVANK